VLSRRVTRFQPRRGTKQPSGWQRLQHWGGLALMALAGTMVALGLFWAPKQLADNHRRQIMDAFNTKHFDDTALVEKHWMALPWLPNFSEGNEPGAREFLRKQPLVNRLESRRMWLRQEDRFVPAVESPLTQTYRRWATRAEMAQRFQWLPSAQDDPEYERIASTVLLGDQWIVIKRWEPGTPAVEAALRQTYGEKPPIRLGMTREKSLKRGMPMADWGREPNIQVDPGRMVRSAINLPATSDYFGQEWLLVALPWEADDLAFRREINIRAWIVRGVASAVGLLMLLALWLRYRARQRALLDMDRLASLTHSLKTPLAVLKFRCDTLRLGRLSPDQADEELIKLGEEVDRLTVIIESGLATLKGESSAAPQGLVDRAWLVELADDLRPAFAAEHRELSLHLADGRGKAALSSLRSALYTLLENALFHGRGRVTFETWQTRRRLVLRIADEGEPLDSTQLEALGRPFMRFRERGSEGFKREGQGLGVSLMCQVAEREGWGLAFASGGGKGLIATLELPLAEAEAAAGWRARLPELWNPKAPPFPDEAT
jgi:signal transduction histidine kinase